MLNRMTAVVGGVLLALLSVTSNAQEYPAKPVRIIVPFSPGGPADIFARFIGQRLQEALGQTFVVDNRPGAGSIIGTDAVAKSAADGYTLLMMSNTHTVNESLIPTKPYQLMRDFVPVAPINYSDLVLVVHPSVPASNLAELLQLAKSKPKELNYASSGNGTPYHMAGELELGILDEVTPRLRAHPNGAAAMRALTQCASARPIGCTQISEIVFAEGVTLVGALPREFELTTVYSIGVCSGARQPETALRFARLVCSLDAGNIRARAGFEA